MDFNSCEYYISENQCVQEKNAYIKRLIFASRNGEAVKSMVAKGVCYRKNLGVSLVRLSEIATMCEPNKELADRLWQSGGREEMILAACLMPIGEFPYDLAMEWVAAIVQVEIAEIVSMKLFSKLPYAEQWAKVLLKLPSEIPFLVGLSIVVRIESTADDAFCQQVCKCLFTNHFDNVAITHLRYTFLENLLFTKPHFRAQIENLLCSVNFENEQMRNFFMELLPIRL